MKKNVTTNRLASLVSLLGLVFLLGSCSIKYATVTNNPVGTKTGVNKAGKFFNPDIDFTQYRAAKNGGVQKIGVVQVTDSFFKMETVVYGE